MTEFYNETLGEINGKTLMDLQFQFYWYQGKLVRKIEKTNYKIFAGHLYDAQFQVFGDEHRWNQTRLINLFLSRKNGAELYEFSKQNGTFIF